MEFESKVIELYEAIISNNGMEVQTLLDKNFNLESTQFSKIIAGLLVISIENNFNESSQAILEYNHYSCQIDKDEMQSIAKYASDKNLFFPRVIAN